MAIYGENFGVSRYLLRNTRLKSGQIKVTTSIYRRTEKATLSKGFSSKIFLQKIVAETDTQVSLANA